MFSLQGHTALVTGGTRGTGQAVAIGLAEAGADVLLVQVSPRRILHRNPRRHLALGRKAQIYTADLSDPASVAALTPKVLADGHEVRVLVNCAGVQRRHSGTSRGVTVNAIAPGYIETDMNEALLNDPERLASISARIPAGRWGRPEDFKGTTVYLASKAAAYVSGHVLVVDGGWMGR
ncbi:hypothetical protein RB601_004048 [Gaeumannomyces tritici]